MKLFNIFKKKKPPIDNPGNYDWNFQFVKGGFCELKNLRKKRKRWLVIMYQFPFKFKWHWNNGDYFWEIPFSGNKMPVIDFQQSIEFDTDAINKAFKVYTTKGTDEKS